MIPFGAMLIISYASWAGETAPTVEPQVLVCPDSLNLCKWDSRSGWSPYWDTEAPEIIQDFRQTKAGDTIVLLRGHQESGRFVILQRDGQPILTRTIRPDGALGLPALTGEDPTGTVVLCGGGPEDFFCDTWLLRGGRAPVAMGEGFPVKCIFPRFLTSEISACVETWSRPRIRIQTRGEVGSFDIALPDTVGSVDDFMMLAEDRFLVLDNRKVLLWQDGELRELSTDPPFAVVRGAQEVYFSGYRKDSESLSFYVDFFTLDGSIGTIWEADLLVPIAILSVGDGLLIDLEGDDSRRLVRFRREGDRFVEKELWSGKSHILENQNR